MPDLPKLQGIQDGLTSNIQSTTAYTAGWAGLVWGLVQDHWLSIISAACLIFTAYWNYKHRQQMTKESKMRMRLMESGQLGHHIQPSQNNGEID